jgi:hypothetical protein
MYEREAMRRCLDTLAVIDGKRYLKEVLSDPKYNDKKRLETYGFKVYSQTDEDGIIQEIFHRIGPGPNTFVEFGVENGLETNTLKLLLDGWSGLWIEGSAQSVDQINAKFGDVISDGRLRVKAAFITRDNFNELIGAYFAGEIDLLSIDIDGNDIYILESVDVVNPRVVIVEYNGKFPPPMSVRQRYNPTHRWSGTDYMGSSLEAITKIAARKGYSLVGCGLTGVNAFFVRNDLLGDRFLAPYTSENHYQPARYFLWQPATHPTGGHTRRSRCVVPGL